MNALVHTGSSESFNGHEVTSKPNIKVVAGGEEGCHGFYSTTTHIKVHCVI